MEVVFQAGFTPLFAVVAVVKLSGSFIWAVVMPTTPTPPSEVVMPVVSLFQKLPTCAALVVPTSPPLPAPEPAIRPVA